MSSIDGEVQVREPVGRVVGPGFVGFEPSGVRVASTVCSRDAVSVLRVLSATGVKGLSDDECLGVYDDIEVVRRSLDAFAAGVAAEIDSRALCDLRYGTGTAPWFERRHGRSRAAVAREVKVGKKLRVDLDVLQAAALRGEVSFERVAFIAGKVNPRNADAMSAAQSALLDLEPPWVRWRLQTLEARMEPCLHRERRGSRRHGVTAMRRGPRRCGWCVSCAPSWGPIMGR